MQFMGILPVCAAVLMGCSANIKQGGEFDVGNDGSSLTDINIKGNDYNSDGNVCAWETTESKRAEVDIIFVIDNSHSMRDEIQKTINNTNNFAMAFANSGLDYQVIMVSAKGTNLTDMSEDVPNLKGSGLTGDMPIEVCMPPPLGVGPGGVDPCGDNPPFYYHLDHWPFGIASNNGMWLALATYDPDYKWPDNVGPPGGGWAQWARFSSTKYFIVITDDDASVPDATFGDPLIVGDATEPYEVFDRLILNTDPPGMFGDETARKYVYNTICGWTFPGGLSLDPESGGGCQTEVADPDYNSAENPGEQHQKLAQLTGGDHRIYLSERLVGHPR